MSEWLRDLESRVTDKWLDAANNRAPNAPYFDFDASQWTDADPDRIAESISTTPQVQWIVYPARRATILTVVDSALDRELSDKDWQKVCYLMQYGGKERIA